MNSKLAVLVVAFLAVGLVSNAFAHKSQTIGNYNIEVGWAKEPPKVGKANAVEVNMELVKKSTSKKNEVSGLAKTLQIDINLNGKKSTLTMKEDPKKPGSYTGAYTPSGAGYPTVHLYTKINGKNIEGSFHPEKVEK